MIRIQVAGDDSIFGNTPKRKLSFLV
jgi:hypothetical protein